MNKGINAVLEITPAHVKLAVAKTSPSGKVITFLGAKAIPETSNQAISKALKELIDQSKIKPQGISCVIPRGSTIVRNLRLPSHDPAEIENMLDFQIKERIPYSKDDIITDYLIISKDTKGYSDILLVTAHKTVVERYIEILNSINIAPELFSLSSLGVSKWYSLYQANINKVSNEAVLLFSVDTVVTDLCFCLGKNLIYSRSISFGLDDINNEKIEGLLEQTRLTLTTYRKEKNNPEVSKIILITQSEKSMLLFQRLKSELSLSVEVVNPLENTQKSRKLPSSFLTGLEEVSFTAVLGFSLVKEEDELNLLPEDIRRKQKIKSLKKEFIFSGSFAVLAILLAIGAVSLDIYKKEQYLKQIDIELTKISSEVNEVKDTTKKLELIKENFDYEGSVIDIIYELYNILPSSMSLNVFNLDEKGNITLQGVSSQMSDIYSFQSSLGKSKYFKNVEVKYACKMKTRQGELTDFSIVCEISRE